MQLFSQYRLQTIGDLGYARRISAIADNRAGAGSGSAEFRGLGGGDGGHDAAGAPVGRKCRPEENRGGGKRLRLTHPDNGLALRFEEGAVAVSPLQPRNSTEHKVSDWHWGLKLIGYGTPSAIRPVAPAQAVAAERRLEYRRGAVAEWYENRPEGLEQGFTLAEPPATGAEDLVLSLAVEGGLQPSLDPAGRAVAFRDATGAAVLHYKDLQVTDAAGKSIPARLALAGDGVQIHVDARGAVWPIVVDPLVSSQQIVAASDAATTTTFGFSVAVSGDTALVGAAFANYGGFTTAGKAYVYVRSSGGVWSQQAILNASDPEVDAKFGSSVALYGDTALIGAPYATSNSSTWAGQAYVFIRSGTTWTQQALLYASDQTANAFFGWSVALSGETALVGAYQANSGGKSKAGQAYVFTRSGAVWTEQAILYASDRSPGFNFGNAVALSGDTALIGAYSATYPSSPNLAYAGKAYVFVRSGTAWTEQQALPPPDPQQLGRFGYAVALSGDTALISQPYRNTVGPLGAGEVFVFARSGSSWRQQQILYASDAAGNAYFGNALALSGDTALVGAYNANSPIASGAGKAYVFARSGTTWTEQKILYASDGAYGDNFGNWVALSGNTALVGAPYGYSGGNADAGKAYFYTFPCAFGTGVVATGSPSTSLWKMIALPCNPQDPYVGYTFGDLDSTYANFSSAGWNSTWGLYTRNAATDAYAFSNLGAIVSPGTGYWLKSYNSPTYGAVVINGSATPVTTSAQCASANGCYSITLTSTASASGLMNLVGNPLPYDIDWANVRLLVDDVAVYAPVAAQIGNLMSKSFSIWNGTSYDTYDDVTPGLTGALKVFQSFWVKTLPGSSGHTLKLLIPAKPSTTSQAFPMPSQTLAAGTLPWYLGWLDWVVAPVKAEEAGLAVEAQGAGMKAQGLAARAATRRSHASALASLKAWYVRLKLDNPALGYKDSGNILGQLPDAKAGYDAYDLAEPAPFAAPYLTLVFPHKDWGDKAGAYASDYRPAKGLKAMSWDIEIRADQAGSEVRVSWQGDPRILARSRLTDLSSGQTYSVGDPDLVANGVAVFLADKVQRLRWRYLGGLGKP
ncbi:FG-GAP repeat protein [Methylococcus mesophilus]|uniref:FG-GAP repeat protein n=1 Tax=Methylococcus mesophilus TaxID=2993564 RepID=UPI00224AB0CD|nr:FG-GAP repeat protein [Methylococcus mesophilus]UZR30044.1 FG-GAP repeat protein [Methylococcus mesophilus]